MELFTPHSAKYDPLTKFMTYCRTEQYLEPPGGPWVSKTSGFACRLNSFHYFYCRNDQKLSPRHM